MNNICWCNKKFSEHEILDHEYFAKEAFRKEIVRLIFKDKWTLARLKRERGFDLSFERVRQWKEKYGTS